MRRCGVLLHLGKDRVRFGHDRSGSAVRSGKLGASPTRTRSFTGKQRGPRGIGATSWDSDSVSPPFSNFFQKTNLQRTLQMFHEFARVTHVVPPESLRW